MKNFTKWLSLVLVIAMCASVMVGCVNAVNLTDGVDGLCGSVTIPVMVFFTVAAVAAGNGTVALVSAAMIGALFGFLCYNFHPAKVFMGDTGSLFLGSAVTGNGLLYLKRSVFCYFDLLKSCGQQNYSSCLGNNDRGL